MATGRAEKKLWLGVLLPVLFLAVLIYKGGVNVPFWDEWELVPIFQHLHTGNFFFSDFWLQHNEHRLLWPTLVLVGLAQVTHWSLQVENLANLVVAIGSFAILTRMVLGGWKLSSKREGLLLMLLALIWFSPGQFENWLWGWQLEWFMNVLGLMLVAFSISRLKGRNLSRGTSVLLLGGGILAQYSLGSGTLVWPVVIVALLYKKVEARKLLMVAMTGILATLLYFFHYANPPEPSKTLALHQPLQFVEYVIGYLGRPLSHYQRPALFIGAALIITFVGLSSYLYVKRRNLFDKNLPWLFLGLYTIAAAAATGIARLGFGVEEAYSGRYITISSLLLVSVIMICWQSRQLLRQLAGDMYKILVPITVVALFILVVIQGAWGVHGARIKHRQLLEMQHCTRMTAPTEQCLLKAYPDAAIVSERLRYIKSIHWGGY